MARPTLNRVAMTRRGMYIEDSMWKRLDKVARREGQTVSALIRQAVKEYLVRYAQDLQERK